MTSEWQKAKLDDVLFVKRGESITKKDAQAGPYPVILGGKEPAYYIDKFNHIGKAIVISRSGASAGYVSFWNQPIFVTDGFLLEPKDGISYEFLYYLLKSKQYELNHSQRGAAIPHVTPNLIKSISIILPPCEDREKLASILSAYDFLIDNNQKRIILLEKMAEMIYREWFVRLKFPGYEASMFEGGLPKGWKYKTLGEIVSFERGVSYSSEEIDCADGLNLVNLKNIEAFGGYRRDGLKHYNGKYKTTQVVNKGDLVMGVTDMTQDRRTVGAVALIPEIQGTSVISADLVKIVSKLPNLYLYCLCRFGNYSKYFSLFANGANVLHLKPNTLLNKKVLIPTDNLINLFVEKIQSSIDCIDDLNRQNDLLIQQKNLLLPRLMSGKIEVNI